MIGLIGFKKVLIILILLAVVITLGVANFQFLRPKAEKLERDLNNIKNEESTLRSEIEVMRGNMDQFNRQKVLFGMMEKDSFFNVQDRVAAREELNSMQSEARVVSLKYEIRSASMSLPPDTYDDKYALLTSPLSIQIDAMDDVDVYKFVGLLLYNFPGIVNIKSLDIEAQTKLTPDVLRRISSGEAPVLVDANIEADWITIAPWGTAPWSDTVDPALINAGGAQ